jgi:hypothetical protein
MGIGTILMPSAKDRHEEGKKRKFTIQTMQAMIEHHHQV